MKYIKEAVNIFFKKDNFVYFFRIYFVSFLLALLTSFIRTDIALKRGGYGGEIWIYIIPQIILFPIGVWAQASGYEAVRRVVGGGAFEFKDTYRTSWRYLWKFLTVNALVGLIVAGGTILLIIPGIIFGVWYAFSTWGVVEKGYGVVDSLKGSKTIVTGKFWKVLGQLALFVLFVLIGQIAFSFVPTVGPIIATIFGGLFLLPYYLLYRELSADKIQ